MIIEYEQSWCEFLTPCPFDHTRTRMVGEYECEHCEHCLKRGSSTVTCMHPEGRKFDVAPERMMQRHVRVVSCHRAKMQVIEEDYYDISKVDALQLFKQQHPEAFSGETYCKAFYPYQLNDENKLRARFPRITDATRRNAVRKWKGLQSEEKHDAHYIGTLTARELLLLLMDEDAHTTCNDLIDNILQSLPDDQVVHYYGDSKFLGHDEHLTDYITEIRIF